jgi:hypothetical protein
VFNNVMDVIKSKTLKTTRNAARRIVPSNPRRSPFHIASEVFQAT